MRSNQPLNPWRLCIAPMMDRDDSFSLSSGCNAPCAVRVHAVSSLNCAAVLRGAKCPRACDLCQRVARLNATLRCTRERPVCRVRCNSTTRFVLLSGNSCVVRQLRFRRVRHVARVRRRDPVINSAAGNVRASLVAPMFPCVVQGKCAPAAFKCAEPLYQRDRLERGTQGKRCRAR